MMHDNVQVLQSVKSKNSIGITQTNFDVLRTITADVQPLKYDIRRKPFGITDKTSHMIICYDFGITADMRIGYNGDRFLIDSILPYKKHVELYVQRDL